MVDIDLIRKNPQAIKEMMVTRNKSTDTVDLFMRLDDQWRELVGEIQALRVEQKQYASQRNIEGGKEAKQRVQDKERALAAVEHERYEALLEIPNIPFDDVPRGKDESENVVVKTVGNIPQSDFEPQDHLALGEKLGIIDIKKASEVAGSRFYYLKGKGALLELALIRYAFDVLGQEGFEAVIPPVMIKPEVYEKMGRLTPSQQEERYFIERDNMYLVGSAEHTLGPLGMDETFSADYLPKRYVGVSSCFRREAGSYGKDVRGILRVHQFDKVEMYSFTSPDQSEKEHELLLSLEERIFGGLEIPYRIVAICTGDMGTTDARAFDIEGWMPAQNTYREIASCSNTTDYQTRGINTKVRSKEGSAYAHALNATALAVGRTIIALLENFQRADGSISIPKMLQKYTGFDTIEA